MSLTDEDKAWIAKVFAGNSENAPTQLTGRIEKTEMTPLSEVAEAVEKLRTDVRDRLERLEATLLAEFRKGDSPVELRQRSHSAALRAFDAELEAVSDRVTKIERQSPPAA